MGGRSEADVSRRGGMGNKREGPEPRHPEPVKSGETLGSGLPHHAGPLPRHLWANRPTTRGFPRGSSQHGSAGFVSAAGQSRQALAQQLAAV